MNGTARIIDVNLNRLAEALKVVEDLCRFELNDKRLVAEVRRLRARFQPAVRELRRKVLPFRSSRTDSGRSSRFDRTPRTSPADILHANLKRIQEAARILEEMTRLEFPQAFPVFKALRFGGYDLELELAARGQRKLNLRLYVVMDTATIGRRNLARIAGQLAQANINVVQLREPKDLPTREFLQDARAIKQGIRRAAGRGPRTVFIVNDRVDIALAVDADGVHLGQEDLPLGLARKQLPADKTIGVSAATVAEARQAEKAGADYLGVGSVFPTASKSRVRVIGLKRLKAIRRATSLPIVAIGGVTRKNARAVLSAGADGLAVISAVFGSGHIAENLRALAAVAVHPR